MDTQDKRFIAGALGEGARITPTINGIGGGFTVAHACEWPYAPHAGIRTVTVHSTAPPAFVAQPARKRIDTLPVALPMTELPFVALPVR